MKHVPIKMRHVSSEGAKIFQLQTIDRKHACLQDEFWRFLLLQHALWRVPVQRFLGATSGARPHTFASWSRSVSSLTTRTLPSPAIAFTRTLRSGWRRDIVASSWAVAPARLRTTAAASYTCPRKKFRVQMKSKHAWAKRRRANRF